MASRTADRGATPALIHEVSAAIAALADSLSATRGVDTTSSARIEAVQFSNMDDASFEGCRVRYRPRSSPSRSANHEEGHQWVLQFKIMPFCPISKSKEL